MPAASFFVLGNIKEVEIIIYSHSRVIDGFYL